MSVMIGERCFLGPHPLDRLEDRAAVHLVVARLEAGLTILEVGESPGRTTTRTA
jgi:hypothetical protein